MHTNLNKGLASVLTVLSLAIPMSAMAANATDTSQTSPAASIVAASNPASAEKTEAPIFDSIDDYIDSLTAMSQEDKTALKAVYQELNRLFDVHSDLYDEAGNVKPGKEADVTAVLDQIDATYEKITQIYTDVGLEAPFAEDVTSPELSDEANAALETAYQELNRLFDVHSDLYDEAGNVKPGKEAEVTAVLDQIDALYEKIAQIYTDAGVEVPFVDDVVTVELSEEAMARLDSAFAAYDKVFNEWTTLFDETGLVKHGSEAKEAELSKQMDTLQEQIDAIFAEAE